MLHCVGTFPPGRTQSQVRDPSLFITRYKSPPIELHFRLFKSSSLSSHDHMGITGGRVLEHDERNKIGIMNISLIVNAAKLSQLGESAKHDSYHHNDVYHKLSNALLDGAACPLPNL